MNEELEIIVLSTKDSMELSVDHLKKELLKIRAGKANPVMLNSISVDYYGTLTPLNQIANINSPDARTKAGLINLLSLSTEYLIA